MGMDMYHGDTVGMQDMCHGVTMGMHMCPGDARALGLGAGGCPTARTGRGQGATGGGSNGRR